MVDEFMGTVNDYVRESELQELRDAVEKTRRAMKGQGNFEDLLDPVGLGKPAVVNDPKIAPTTPELPAPEIAQPVTEAVTDPAPAEPAPKPEGQGTP